MRSDAQRSLKRESAVCESALWDRPSSAANLGDDHQKRIQYERAFHRGGYRPGGRAISRGLEAKRVIRAVAKRDKEAFKVLARAIVTLFAGNAMTYPSGLRQVRSGPGIPMTVTTANLTRWSIVVIDLPTIARKASTDGPLADEGAYATLLHGAVQLSKLLSMALL